MNILITGGAGFIGSNLCEILLAENNVICIDNFNDYYSPIIKKENIKNFQLHKRFKLYEGDIRDKEYLNYIFSENNIDIIIHLAAMAGVRNSIEKPDLYFDVNLMGTLNVLEAMRNHNIINMIFASSSSVYGNNRTVPFSESDNIDSPISPYAASKKSCELLCYTYHHLYNFNITCLRFFTVYGPKQRPDLAIYQFTKALFEDLPINIYGDGKIMRDYTHIKDIIQGIILSIKHLDGYDIFNLGESVSISVIDLVKLLEKYTGEIAKIRFLPIQPGDAIQTYADVTKAKLLLGYSPMVNLEDGLNDFIGWYKSNVLNKSLRFSNNNY